MDRSEINRANGRKRGSLSYNARKRLSDAARKNMPWLHSTGARTAVGKAANRMNARRHGMRAAHSRAATHWLNALRDGLDALRGVASGHTGGLTVVELQSVIEAMKAPPLGLDAAAVTDWLSLHRGHAPLSDPQLLLPFDDANLKAAHRRVPV